MSTIDESIKDLIDTAEGFGRGMVSVENVELAQLWLHSLIAAALADARRDGAEAMREAAAAAALENRPVGATSSVEERAIRALPLPTGERQAVRLTEVDVIREVCIVGLKIQTPEGAKQLCRAIETAVLAANNLEVRRG